MIRRIKVAQIGAGHDHAMVVIQALKKLDGAGIIELVGFCTVPEDLQNTADFLYENNKEKYLGVKKLSLDEILNYEGLDAVTIETEDRALTKYAMLAADKKLNIHMDKPGSADEKEFNELADTCEREGLVFHTGYMYRYNPEILKLKQDISDGKLGDIISVEAQMNCIHKLEKRNWMGNYPGGMLYYLGCHMIDLIYSILGEPEKIIPLSCSSNAGGTLADDFGMVVFKYKNGVSFAKSSSVEVGGFERRQLVVSGTKGTVEICPLEWMFTGKTEIFTAQTTGVREIFSDDWHKSGDRHISDVHGRYDAMLMAFTEYVCGEKKNPFTYDYEKNLHRILLKSCGKIKEENGYESNTCE